MTDEGFELHFYYNPNWLPFTPILGALGNQWILPRAKKCPPDTFYTSASTGVALSNPIQCKKSPTTKVVGDFLAEDEGFEPPQTESESGVLPLHKSSMRILLYPSSLKSQEVFSFFAKIFPDPWLLYPKKDFLCKKMKRLLYFHFPRVWFPG